MQNKNENWSKRNAFEQIQSSKHFLFSPHHYDVGVFVCAFTDNSVF